MTHGGAGTALLYLLASASAQIQRYAETDGVIDLSEAVYDKFVAEEPVTLIMFYAPWCAHCKDLQPVLVEAAQKGKQLSSRSVRLARVDADQHPALAERLQLTGYPAMKLVSDGVVSEYHGPRSADGIVDTLKRLLASGVQELVSGEALAALRGQLRSGTLRGVLMIVLHPDAHANAMLSFKQAAFELSTRHDVAFR